MTARLDIEHDLPPDLADALGDDRRSVGTLYNELQDLSGEAFRDRFDDAFGRLTEAVPADAEFVVVVLGLEVDTETDPFVTDAGVVAVHEPNPDGSVGTLHFVADDAPTDTFVMLPIRPADCPPGSGRPVSQLTVEEFRDIVSAMVYKRFDLLDSDIDAYRDSYLRPLVRGVEAYASA
ncbi:hypothetical protein [Halosegnis longus]|uniref:Uncharacterized protein n=1 Tax=Halosegnis longus TaxID=2216012 RepID=A0AAJ4R7N6_9EURY|nr:hypothetical protein [Halosegnis longus]RNJ25740.1 hypothetical protein Nmn1133_02905 [Salella cibi]